MRCDLPLLSEVRQPFASDTRAPVQERSLICLNFFLPLDVVSKSFRSYQHCAKLDNSTKPVILKVG